MKFISLAPLFISVISLVLPAALAVYQNAQKVINYIDDAEPTDLSPAFFWSGYTKVYYGNHSVTIKAEASLDNWRKDIKCHLITEVVSKAKVKDSDLTRDDWKDISRRFAGAVSGQVYVLLGKEINKDSVWLKDEAPALKANKDVTSIKIWEIDTDGKIKKTSKVQDQAALALSDDAKKVLKFITNDAKPADLNPACFYSGYTYTKGMNPGNRYAKDWMRIWAWEKGFKCHFLLDIIIKAKVDPYELEEPDLIVISKAFAQAVSGKVYVLLGNVIQEDEDSVWLQGVKPALSENTNVDGEFWEINTYGKYWKTSTSKNAQIIIGYLHRATPDLLNPACFYSGYTDTIEGKKRAHDYVLNWAGKQSFDCHLIFNIVKTAQAKTGVDPNLLTDDDWKVISREFARVASGRVYVLLGKEIRQNSVWLEDEQPVLMENEYVLNIEVWEVSVYGGYEEIKDRLKMTGAQDQGYIQSRIGWDSQQGQYAAHL